MERTISLSHAKKSRSKYKGGFIKIKGRSNNSSDYNHDYYIHNKSKWKTKLKGWFDKAKATVTKYRNMAIDMITDFAVDLSMAYVNKMLSEENLGSVKIDEIVANENRTNQNTITENILFETILKETRTR